MADDAAVEVAEALKDALNAGSWSQEFTAVRAYDLTAELEDDGIVHVDVAVRSDSGDLDGRGTTENIIEIDTAVRKKCDVSVIANLDALMLLIQEFRDDLLVSRLATATEGDAWCFAWERDPAYYPKHIRDYRQFTGMLTLRFKLVRAIP